VRIRVWWLLAAVLGVWCACGSSAVDASAELSAIPRAINDSGQVSVLTVKVIDRAGKPGKGSVMFKAPAGTLKTAVSVPLGPTGEASVDFSCAIATDPGCVGSLRVAVEWTSGTEFASSFLNVQIGDLATGAGGGTGVATASNCLSVGNSIYFNGETGDYIHPGSGTITQGKWVGRSTYGGLDGVSISVTPMDSKQGSFWSLDFSSKQLGEPLAVKAYTKAERAAFASAGHPGVDIGGNGVGCNTVTGAFQVETITWDGPTLKEFTATFEQHCEGGKPALRGCVHFAQ
jgi:hypothetical protein